MIAALLLAWSIQSVPNSVGADTVIVESIGSFTDARSLSVAPDGAIFVVDFGRQRVVRLADGSSTVLGVSATRPTAVDAARSLSVLVADGASGSIHRVGPDGNLILRMAVPADAEEAFEYAPSFQESQIPSGTFGVPLDVLQLRSGWIVAVEEHARALLFWDESGRPVKAITHIEGDPLDPGQISGLGEGLLVLLKADQGLLRLDQFGTLVGRVHLGHDDISAIGPSNNDAWAMAGQTLYLLDSAGDTVETLQTGGLEGRVVDLAATGSDVLILTSTNLYRVSRHSQ